MHSNTKLWIKLLVGGWLAVLLGWAVELTPSFIVFLVYYTLLCFQTSIGATVNFIKTALKWCSFGNLLGLGVSIVLDFSLRVFGKESLVIWAILGVLVFFGAYAVPKGPEARLGFITALLVAVAGQESAPWQDALLRGTTLFLALMLGITVSVFLFPRRAREVATQQLTQLIEGSVSLFTMVMRHILKQGQESTQVFSEKHILGRVFYLRQQLMETQKCVLYSKEDTPHADAFIQLLIYQQGRVLNYIVLLTRDAEKSRNSAVVQKFVRELYGISLHIQHALLYWVALLKREWSPISLRSMRRVYRKIERRLKKQDLNQLQMNELSAFFGLYHDLQAFCGDLERILSTTQEQLPSRPIQDEFTLLF